MYISLQILFSICIVSVISVAIMTVVFKKEDASAITIIIQGSFIFCNLDKYIKQKYILPIRIMSYVGIISFLVAILEIIIQGI